MARPMPRNLIVVNVHSLTPNMVRITLGGEELLGFPEDQESGYIKLIFPSEDGEQKPRMRTYTVRTFDSERQQMEVDFVVHGDTGPASAWAMNAKIGDTITIAGPGAKKMVDMSADWFFIAGDMTALPAISVNLEHMPTDAKGYAVVEILSEADKQDLVVPDGMEVHWIINSKPDQPHTMVLDTIKSLPWLDGKPYVWAAGEFGSIRAVRRYFKKERDVGRREIYASSYWKIGETEEGNKAAKNEDQEDD